MPSTASPRVLLIGTDCPLARSRGARRGARRLDDHDAVLGPAEDGGFVLVGARAAAAVRRRAVEHAARLRGRDGRVRARGHPLATTLPVSWDVDEPADFARWEALRLAAAAAAA